MFLNTLAAGLELTSTIAYESYTEFAPFQPDRPSHQLETAYTNGASEFVEVGDAKIHYRDEGPRDAPTILAVHGTYSSLHTWEGLVEELSEEFRVVRLDMPGFGLTGPRTAGSHSLSYLVEAVGQFCDALSLSEVAVVGNSLGGGISWRLSVDRPELVSELVLINAGGATLLSELAANLTALGSELVPRYVTPRMTIRVLLNDAYGDGSRLSDAEIRRYHDLLLRPGNRRAVIEIATAYEENHDGSDSEFDTMTPKLPSAYEPSPTIWDGYELGAVPVPTLFLWGERDEWLPLSFGRELAANIPDTEFVTYPELGHVPMEESPAKTAPDVASFLNSERSGYTGRRNY